MRIICMDMRKYMIAAAASLFMAASFPLPASSASGDGPAEIADLTEFNAKLEKMTSSVNSIDSRFEQRKYMDVLQRDVVSCGSFSFVRPGKIKMEYDEPVDYTIVMDNKSVTIVSSGSENRTPIQGNPMFSQIQNMMTACMTGDLSVLGSDFTVKHYEDGEQYLVVLVPENSFIKSYITKIELLFDRTTMSLDSLRMTEGGSDYTEYRFSDVKYNLQ